jgi:hypothetical protein
MYIQVLSKKAGFHPNNRYLVRTKRKPYLTHNHVNVRKKEWVVGSNAIERNLDLDTKPALIAA